MINTKPAREFLNQVSPEIKEHWEKKNNVSLARNIAKIEEIDTQKMVGDDRIGLCNKLIIALIVIILVLSVILGAMFLKYPHIQSIYPYTIVALITVTLFASVCCHAYIINLSMKLSDYRFDKEQQQEILSDVVKTFLDTILMVCTPPKTGLVDAEYLKGVMHGLIKDLLLKKAEYGVRRKNMSFRLDEVAPFALKYVNSGEYLEKQCTIVEDGLGVKLDMKKMFKKAAEEMRITYPGLSEFFEVE